MSVHLNPRRIRSTVGGLAFCVGMMLVPALTTAGIGIGLGCRGLDQRACLRMLAQTQLQAEMVELGGDTQQIAALGQPRQ